MDFTFRTYLPYFFSLVVLISCNNTAPKRNEQVLQKKFSISARIENNTDKTIFLYTLQKNRIKLLDSTIIKNDSFGFSGMVAHPYKALLQIKSSNMQIPFILANEDISINCDSSDNFINTFIDSPINNDFLQLRNQSAAIYQKIDYLFPQLQKARMENDYKTLTEINSKIKIIEEESNKHLINYIQNNSEKHLSALLLNDLWNTQYKDSALLQTLSKNLSFEVQKTLDFPIN